MRLEKLHIPQTDETPEVFLNSDSSESYISGRSLPENAFDFYDPILKWIKSYALSCDAPFVLKLHFEYFNSSSSRYLFELLSILELSKFKENYSIIWITDKDDELMIDKGIELKGLCDISFRLEVSNS